MLRTERRCAESMEKASRHSGEELCPGSRSALETAATPERDRTPATAAGNEGARQREIAARRRLGRGRAGRMWEADVDAYLRVVDGGVLVSPDAQLGGR
jgi:pyruvate/2-oxoglutarate dehydrogenase complex dihydrolipoamide acyltransferase (E2) component